MKSPNFIIAGERRSGTTTLAKLMERHPEIYMYPSMDMAYFMDDALRGRKEWLDGKVEPSLWDEIHTKEEYFNFFSGATEEQIAIGEKSADYLFLENCHGRIKKIIPNAKIILTFRNPIERAWSHYWNEIGKGRESETFEKSIELEKTRIEQSDYAKAHLSYVSRGFYLDSLNVLYKTFDKSNIKVVILEELIANPERVLRGVYDFLKIDSNIKIKGAQNSYNKNWTSIPKPFWVKNKGLECVEKQINKLIVRGTNLFVKDAYKKRSVLTRLESITRNTKKDFVMNNSTRKELQNIYMPSIERLEKELNKDLSTWKL